MNGSRCFRSYRPTLGGILLCALAAGLAAGCGSSPHSASQRPPSSTAGPGPPAGLPAGAVPTGAASGNASAANHRLAAIKYAQCMRSHGVNVLDPDQNGNVNVDAPDAPKAVIDRADQACEKQHAAMAASEGMTPAQQAEAVKKVTNYARCMCAHNVPMADPFTGPNGGVGYSIPQSVSPSSQLFKKADAACHHYLPNGA
jgi:hypothetical protein